MVIRTGDHNFNVQKERLWREDQPKHHGIGKSFRLVVFDASLLPYNNRRVAPFSLLRTTAINNSP
jgi:hypothetical protein